MATRIQTNEFIKWAGADSKTITPGTPENSSDFLWDTDLISAEITIKGVSAGSASDDIVDVYYSRKKNFQYDDQANFVCSVDCSSGSGMKTMQFNSAFPADLGRFTASCGGTNSITVSVFVTQDKLVF